MKTLISLATALALALVPLVAPVVADDSSFHALSNLPAEEHAALTPLTDDQLASIEGEGICVACLSAVTVAQANLRILTVGGGSQSNRSTVITNQGTR